MTAVGAARSGRPKSSHQSDRATCAGARAKVEYVRLEDGRHGLVRRANRIEADTAIAGLLDRRLSDIAEAFAKSPARLSCRPALPRLLSSVVVLRRLSLNDQFKVSTPDTKQAMLWLTIIEGGGVWRS